VFTISRGLWIAFVALLTLSASPKFSHPVDAVVAATLEHAVSLREPVAAIASAPYDGAASDDASSLGHGLGCCGTHCNAGLLEQVAAATKRRARGGQVSPEPSPCSGTHPARLDRPPIEERVQSAPRRASLPER
jgi:hypothetical protein